LGLRFKTIGL